MTHSNIKIDYCHRISLSECPETHPPTPKISLRSYVKCEVPSTSPSTSRRALSIEQIPIE
eukprot:scaffold14045_cov82-Skeletonema_dohrnii-CCMP3373.AAC.1